ncbi:hypothetical protein ASPWEDRAFT_32593 [Aspergillus wentii DTO 134E9]|uniref:Uncharacterized protein n=1 Tax=Aspergillus wentii DTO 134E9 TaxID=1073089 RepID=A0A1L9R6A2_ASPWE|nr:uncharacterized protein ASPWEDRAFT_32593 [Aspergillus wentii DTO 134E9]KAI9926916.1 hypothetical protein MW887_004015 [Aspergillus wentii]OJJ30413.1 hypothetical protein ASPWEDRAFT_32593 [Aspergillus wentii DTO 134E9]
MAYRQQGLSRTLPKNFTFPSMSAGEPRTPERASIHLDVPPPPPRPASCRVRRSRVRSGTDVFAQAEYDRTTLNPNLPDFPLPSIEFPFSHDASTSVPCSTLPASDDRFLAPPRDRVALKTPPAQIRATPIDCHDTGAWASWDHQDLGNTLQRPGSACSHASDSSVSSIETFASRRSMGGSCTSAESDSHDPFFYLELPKNQVPESSPVPKYPIQKSRAPRTKERWTLDMDNHLWNTYQLYIQDPKITPFKMTPGSIPPLGVTHRVAREAKRTWERRRLRTHRQLPFAMSQSQQCRSGNSTPTPKSEAAKPSWPKSEASTRRRLKYLSKRKFSIAPHYQRMMESRSPTPASDMFAQESRETSRADVPDNSSTVYATRDLGVSLVSSSVPGPLAQLAAEEPSPQTTNPEWFNQPLQYGQPDVVEPSPKTRFGLEEPAMAPRLGSPFMYHTWGPDSSKRRNHRHAPMGRRETIHVTGSRLRSPPRMEPFPGVGKSANKTPDRRRSTQLPSDHDTPRHLEELLSQGKLNDVGPRRVRIRNRGVTMSAVNSRGLDQLFSPPSSSSRNEETTPVQKPVPNPLLNLSGESIKRLGSPFKVEGNRRSGPIGRFRHAPSLSDPFASGMLPHQISQPQHPGIMGGGLPYDPTEQGISDAERIKRQILNMSYSTRS